MFILTCFEKNIKTFETLVIRFFRDDCDIKIHTYDELDQLYHLLSVVKVSSELEGRTGWSYGCKLNSFKKEIIFANEITLCRLVVTTICDSSFCWRVSAHGCINRTNFYYERKEWPISPSIIYKRHCGRILSTNWSYFVLKTRIESDLRRTICVVETTQIEPQRFNSSRESIFKRKVVRTSFCHFKLQLNSTEVTCLMELLVC